MAKSSSGSGEAPGSKSTRRWASLSALVLSFMVVYLWHQKGPPTLQKRATRVQDFLSDGYSATSNATSLRRRDDYTCSKSNPCRNGACCGSSGYCGYGPTYCGSGCQSQCDAHAECGQYAKTPGTTCPLNTCCSQYGFCGTTQDFCTTNCQSNCVLHPKPPGSATSTSSVSHRVIGYYESWSARKDCHKVAPEDLPLDVLTHVNFAFGYIDPTSLDIVPMDGATPARLFKDAANIKSIKSSIKVWISVGGWTFSDNCTATQPVFGAIAADAGKRQLFANKVVSFMRQYGFDGLDIDWEYPGAPDRGGHAQDTQNYVALVKTLHDTFASSGSDFGLTFTAPSSYWYLRWFDLPGMLPYVDWINLMSYDLHGVWDASNPIGSIVQGHTNLTEIKLAAELFWRVKVPPSKMSLGFGFYGRSFTLSDPSCTKPGCAFKGASNPGPCSAAGGILAYYEIMSVLSAHTDIKPTHDQESAVKYFTFAKDQWVSYDDEVTFKQKVDWANSIGFGGALIWASDLDDDKYTAHAGLVGREVRSNPSLQLGNKAMVNALSVRQNLAGSNGQDCFKYDGKCVNLNDNAAMQAACGDGFTVVGWDDAGCGKKSCHCGKPICCPRKSAPKDCTWRGNNNGRGTKTDCSAQCWPGEQNIAGIGSSWGGGFTNDGNTDKCGRGYKVFCCPNPDERQVTQGCYYAKCRASCKAGYTSAFAKTEGCTFSSRQYCCPDPVEIVGCHWVVGNGDSDCANLKCNATEVEVDRSQFADSYTGRCFWGRKAPVCCTVQRATPKPASCSANLCNKLPGFCPADGNDEGANGWKGKRQPALVRRDITEYKSYLYNGAIVVTQAAAYPAIGALYGVENSYQILKKTFRLIPGYCIGTAIHVATFVSIQANTLLGLQAEHPIDRQIIAAFIESASAGTLRGKTQQILPAVGAAFFQNEWNLHDPRIAALGAIGSRYGASPDSAAGRIMEAFGSTKWPEPFLATDAVLNGAKGRIMKLEAATAITTITRLANAAVKLDSAAAADELLQAIRIGFAVFDYINTSEGTSKWNLVRRQVWTQFGLIEKAFGITNLQAWWLLFTADYFKAVQDQAHSWADEAITAAAAPFLQAHTNGHNLAQYASVMGTLQSWLDSYEKAMTLPDSSSTLGFITTQGPP